MSGIHQCHCTRLAHVDVCVKPITCVSVRVIHLSSSRINNSRGDVDLLLKSLQFGTCKLLGEHAKVKHLFENEALKDDSKTPGISMKLVRKF